MARDLFEAVVTPHAAVGARSRYTVPLSLAGHGAVVAAIAIMPLLARAALPEVPAALGYVHVMPRLPPEPARPPVSRPSTPATATPLVRASALADVIDAPVAVVASEFVGMDVGGLSCAMPGTPCTGGERLGTWLETELAPAPPPQPPVEPPTPRRVGGEVSPPAKMHHVAPVYPVLARTSRIQGRVIVEATIGVDGAVTDARVLRGVPLLDAAAIEAVRRWRFTPTRLNGVAVPVVMTVTVQFTLQ